MSASSLMEPADKCIKWTLRLYKRLHLSLYSPSKLSLSHLDSLYNNLHSSYSFLVAGVVTAAVVIA